MSERLEKNTAQGLRANESDIAVGLEQDHQGISQPAVPIQYKASGGQELQQEKEQHSGTAEEKYVLASANASSSGGDDDSKNEGNPLQGKFQSGVGIPQRITQYKYQISGSYPAVPIQRMAEEEEPLQGKMSDAIQRMAEEEEPLQGKMSGAIQRMAEEEEPLQGKMSVAIQRMAEEEEPLQGKMSSPIQRMAEEEEPLQGKMSGAIQRVAEEEEPLQGKMSRPIQRMPEEEEPLQGKMGGAIQRMAEEEEPLQGKMSGAIQRTAEEEEPMQGKMSGVVQRESAPEEEEPMQGKMNGAIQRMAEEEEPLQGKMSSPIQRMAEEEEPLQGKMSGAIQRMAEEEEPLQGKMSSPIQRMAEEEEPMQGKMKGAVQRMAEEEEPLQGKMNGAIQRMAEEEEPLQGKMIRPIQKKSSRIQTIQRQSATAAKLPNLVQSKMEGAMGADFSGVNIHTESQNATNVGALAYAQGNDVHFAPGQYDPQSSSGQELIGHELAHVVQQREGRVQPTTQAKGVPVNDDKGLEAEADDMGRKAAQMKVDDSLARENGSERVTSNVLQRAPNAPTKPLPTPPVNATVASNAPTKPLPTPPVNATVASNAPAKPLPTPPVKATVASNAPTKPLPSPPVAAVPATGAPAVVTPAAAVPTKVGLLKPAAVHSLDPKSGKVIHKIIKKLKRGHLVEVDPTTLKKDAKGQDYYAAEGGYIKTIYLGVGGLNNVPGSSVSVTGVADDIDDNEDSLAENAANGIDGTSEAFDGVTAIEGVSESTQKGMGFASSGASMGSGLVGIALAINQIADPNADGWEKLDGGLSLGQSIAQTTEGVLDTVSGASEEGSAVAKNTEMAGTAFGSLGDALNFGKETINAIKTIYDAYQDAKSIEGSSSAEKFEAAMEAVSSAVEASASAVSAVDGVLNMLGQGVAALGQYVMPGLTIVISGLDVAIRTYKMIKANVSRNKMKKRKEEIARKYNRTKKTRFGETVSVTELKNRQKDLMALPAPTAAESEELVDLEEALFVAEMEKINQKRMVRAGINIGIDLVKIGGDIAALTGVGAVATMPMKAFAAGADVSISVFRKLKQMGRDKAAEVVKTNPSSKWNFFNAEKSTENKKAKRRSDADYILKQIAAMEKDTSKPKNLTDTQRIEDYIRAAGGHPQAMYRKFGAEGIGGVKGYLVEIMAKRD